jgi:hypothetical protein
MADVDIIGRFALKTAEFTRDVDQAFTTITGKARASGSQIRTSLGTAFRDVADDALAAIPVIGGELTLLNGKIALAAAAAAGFGLAFTAGLREAETFGKSVRQLDGVLTATGNKTGFLKDQLVAFAEEAEGRLAIPAEDILKTQAALATFDGVAGPIFQRTIESAADIAAVFGGDLSSNAEKLGTALQNLSQGNVEGLSKGFKFLGTETISLIENLAKTGKTSEAQEALLAALESRIGGQGEAAAGGLTGATFRLRDAWGDLLRTLGEGQSGESAINLLDKITAKVQESALPLGQLLAAFDALTSGRFADAFSGRAARDVFNEQVLKASSDSLGFKLPGGTTPPTRRGDRPAAVVERDREAAESAVAAAARSRAAELRTAERAREAALTKELQLLQRQGEALKDLTDTAARLRGNFSEQFDQQIARQAALFNPRGTSIFDAGGTSELQAIVDRQLQAAGFGAKKVAETFEQEGLVAAQAIAQAFGGQVGGQVNRIAGVLRGVTTGDFTSVGGPIGGAATLISRDPATRRALRETFEPLTSELSKTFDELGKSLGLSGGGALVGSAVAGFGIGGAIGGNTESAIGGAIGGTAGSVIGGAVGGPIGAAVGQVLGSILGSGIGGLFSTPKRGSATIAASGGEFAVGAVNGNNDRSRAAVTSIGSSVADSLNRIASTLGADIGGFAVSVGERKGVFSVDPTGRGNVTTKRGAREFSSAEEAARFAIRDAINDGALTGVSQTVINAIRNASTLEKGLDDAVAIQNVAKRLREIDDPLGAALDDLDKRFADLEKTMRRNGATAEELADAERLYSKERDQLLEQSIATLKDFQTSLNIGGSSPLSLTDQRRNAESAFAQFEADILAGRDFDQQAFVRAGQNLLDVERQISAGTAGFFEQFERVQGLTSRAIADLQNVSAIREGPFAQRTAEATQQTADSTALMVNGQNKLIAQNSLILQALSQSGLGGFVGADDIARGFARAL